MADTLYKREGLVDTKNMELTICGRCEKYLYTCNFRLRILGLLDRHMEKIGGRMDGRYLSRQRRG